MSAMYKSRSMRITMYLLWNIKIHDKRRIQSLNSKKN